MKIVSGAITAAICVIFLTGCTSHPDPIIDMQGVDQAAPEVDRDECEAYL